MLRTTKAELQEKLDRLDVNYEWLKEEKETIERDYKKLKRKYDKLMNSYKAVKFDYDAMVKRTIEHRKQLSYKDWTLTLYKRILEDKFMKPTDEK